jgi:hypothetical protein
MDRCNGSPADSIDAMKLHHIRLAKDPFGHLRLREFGQLLTLRYRHS